ncbi:glycerophosphodiester phosphodiesterase [Haloechinothrix halophila]|uniref:glycerophosphodiester phosphodiesterase n=1 Tax=Haloechinothrix halophila TaxID=1069073 RepID=UPI0003FB1381|nr:glycerophosphodiester phosphodiesterase [Haloechinothrix halophila]
MTSRHPYLASPVPRAFAHRGWHIDDLHGMENSLPAFRRAADEGYRHIETDVHATSDGVLVVHHDPTLDRTTDRGGSISELTWSEARRAKIGGAEPVSRLEDVLEELPNAHFNVDVKTDAAVEPFLRTIRRCKAVDRVAAASFSARRLARIRRFGGPQLVQAMDPVSAGVVWATSKVPLVPLGFLARGTMAQVPLRQGRLTVVSPAFVRRAHRMGAEVHVWTVDDAPTMRKLLDIGVDGIITDRPDILRTVLRERGAWPHDATDEAASPPTPRATSSDQADPSP